MVSDIALETAALVLQTIYEEDGEIAALKAMVDQYKRMAERALAIAPMPPVFTEDGGVEIPAFLKRLADGS